MLDCVGLRFCSVVFFISGGVLHFRGVYIRGADHLGRFHCLLLCFVGSIVIFILVPNLFGLIVG